MAVFRIERTRDYTVMSNHHLRDKALSLKSKGLLSMMLSLPEDWNYTTRGLAKICKEGVDAIGGALRELEAAGYIVRHQMRDRQGRISDTEYVIYEQPQPKAPDTPQPDTASPDTENPYLDSPDTEKPAELNIEKSKTQKSNTQGASTDSIPFRETAAARPPERKGRDAMSVEEMQSYRDLVLENIEYDHLCREFSTYREDLDEIVELIVETVCARRKTTRIAGADFPHEVVRSRFLKLDSSHIEFVMECLHNNTTEVRNMKQYLLTVLFNAPHHHEQSLHGPGQPRYARRRLVMAAFSAAPPKEARYEPDGNFQKPGVWKHPHFEQDGKVLFCGTDVATALGYANPRKAVRDHTRCGTKCSIGVQTGKKADGSPAVQMVEMLFIPEGDVYRLIVHSKLPSAERFERWVFDEVLPSIRQHGAYLTREKLWEVATSPEALLKLCSDLLAEREKNAALQADNARLQGKAVYYDLFIDLRHSTNLRTTAKELDVPERRFIRFLLERRYVYRTPSGCVLPYAKGSNEGLFCVKDFCRNGHTGSYTLVTPKGKLHFAELRSLILVTV